MFGNISRRATPFSSLDFAMLRPPAETQPAGSPKPVYLVGLSVGQGAPTGVAVLEKRNPGSGAAATFKCRYLRRVLPPETAYPILLAHLKAMLADQRLTEGHLIVEAGPSIKAVLALLRKHQLPGRVHPVEVKTSAEDKRIEAIWRISKGTVIETARQVIQEERLTFDDQMPPEIRATTPPAQTIYQAMANYPFNKMPTANEAFASRDGEYDDLVLAVALACWFGERYQRTFAINW